MASIVYVKNERGGSDLKEYLINLTRKRVEGAFQATDLVVAIADWKDVELPANPEFVIDGAINIYTFCHEEHIIAYATCGVSLNPGTRFLLTAFHESKRQDGMSRAKILALRIFRPDIS